MARRSKIYNLDVDKIRRNMSIPLHRADMLKEISVSVARCHYEKLRLISVQIGKERSKAIEEKNQGKPISDRQSSLLRCDLAWRMVVAEYNKGSKQYAFLFAAFNILEDSIRVAVLENYRYEFDSDGWHKNDARWPTWVRQKYMGKPEHVTLTGLDSSRAFLESLSFGELIAFIYDLNAWETFHCKDLFANVSRPVDKSPMKNLSRCTVFEKLKILQDRRNIIFHHKPLIRDYRRPVENSCHSSSCNMNRGKTYSDGNANNTIERISEILDYLGIDGLGVLTSLSHLQKTF